MKTAIILHGMPSRENYYDADRPDSQSNSHWIPWLQQKLLQRDILTQAPEMPEPYEPDYKKWCEIFDQFKLDSETDLIGHSAGAGFLVRYLSEHDVKVGKVVLVAPWINPDQVPETDMFDNWQIDDDLAHKAEKIYIVYSTDDDQEIIDSVHILRDKIPAEIIECQNKGHFTFSSMKTREIPEVLNLLV